MKHLIPLLVLPLFTSCAKAYIRAWDQGTVTVCHNKWAGQELIERTASEQCGGGKVTAISGDTDTVGAQAIGYGMYSNITRDCIRYRCDR